MQRIREGISELNATDISLIVVVVIGYIVGVATALSEGWSDSTLAVILVSFVMTAVYLALARGAEQYFERYQSGWAAFAYFAVQLILTTLTINLLGPGAWLIALPIAALAVENLSSWWTRGIVYLGILLGASNTFLRNGLWQPALYFVLMLSTAILFAAVLTRLVDLEIARLLTACNY